MSTEVSRVGNVRTGRNSSPTTNCFRDNGIELGIACDLTGLGSRTWVVGSITDPTHDQLYGDSNNRMPTSAGQPRGSVPLLNPEQIGLVADWLWGQRYRPAH